VWPGRTAAGLACVLGITAGTGTLGPLVALAVPGKPAHHGAHAPRIIQDRVPDLPHASVGPYAPNVCHPNTEQPASRAQLDAWITQAGRLLHRPYSASERRVVWIVIDGESGGKVHAINCWDRNWREGHPSMGLIQAIDTTYMAHAPAGCRRLVLIYDGPCNIAAGTHYAIGRYGSLANVPGVGEVAAGGDYRTGY
jgi:hypothetical protein